MSIGDEAVRLREVMTEGSEEAMISFADLDTVEQADWTSLAYLARRLVAGQTLANALRGFAA